MWPALDTDAVGSINETFGMLGFVIIGIFAASWIVSIAHYRLMDYDAIELRSAPLPAAQPTI